MIDDELIRIWQSSPNHEQVKFKKSQLMLEVKSDLARINRKIYWRDLREGTFALLTMGAFMYGVFYVPLPMLSKIASVLICVWGVYCIVLVANARKRMPGKLTTTLEYLKETRRYLEIQKYMLISAVYWFIVPFLILVSLFLMGFWGVPEKLGIIIKVELISVAGAVLIYVLHKIAVKTELDPKLEKINAVINGMEQ